MKKAPLLVLLCLFMLRSATIWSQWIPFYENKTSSNGLLVMNLKGKVKSVQQKAYKAIEVDGLIQTGEKTIMPGYLSVNADFLMQFDDSARTISEIYPTTPDTFQLHHYYRTKNTELIIHQTRVKDHYQDYRYKYKGDGTIEERTEYTKRGEDVWDHITTYKYNAAGKPIESSTGLRKEKARVKTVYQYDSKGFLCVRSDYKKDTLVYKETFKNDAKGNVLERTYYATDCKSIDHVFIYEYDVNKNVIRKDYMKPEGKLSMRYLYEYEYDKYGNWTRRIDSQNGKKLYVIERQLEYY